MPIIKIELWNAPCAPSLILPTPCSSTCCIMSKTWSTSTRCLPLPYSFRIPNAPSMVSLDLSQPFLNYLHGFFGRTWWIASHHLQHWSIPWYYSWEIWFWQSLINSKGTPLLVEWPMASRSKDWASDMVVRHLYWYWLECSRTGILHTSGHCLTLQSSASVWDLQGVFLGTMKVSTPLFMSMSNDPHHYLLIMMIATLSLLGLPVFIGIRGLYETPSITRRKEKVGELKNALKNTWDGMQPNQAICL
jgi:hypothetical protein